MGIIGSLKQAKHQLFLANKKYGRPVKDVAYKRISDVKKYTYNPEKYVKYVANIPLDLSPTFQVNHLRFNVEYDVSFPLAKAPHRLFVIWAGDNEMPQRRQESFAYIQENNPEFSVELVTPKNLKDYILPEYPLHPAYEYLSYVHKSDYLRAYLMHHYGGAYVDVKPMIGSWNEVLTGLNNDDNLWVSGAPEIGFWNVTPPPGPLGKDQELYYSKIAAQSAMACKPYSPLTYEWIAEIERRLDYFSSMLYEGCAEQPYGNNPEYPIPWLALLGQVFSPLCMKYMDHVAPVWGMHYEQMPEGHR